MYFHTLWSDECSVAVECGTTDSRKELFTPQDAVGYFGRDASFFPAVIGQRDADFVASILNLLEFTFWIHPAEKDGFVLFGELRNR